MADIDEHYNEAMDNDFDDVQICPKCGEEVGDIYHYCPECGCYIE